MSPLRQPLHAGATVLLALASTGCGGPETEGSPATPTETRSLVNHDAWRSTDDDPLASHQPAEVSCPSGSYYVEDGALEIQTGYCNYLALEQASLVAVTQGDQIELLMFHADLDAPEPAELHLALLWDDEVAWERTSTIPGSAQVFDLSWSAPQDRPAGSRLVLHLHNHGFNSYKFVALDVRSAP